MWYASTVRSGNIAYACLTIDVAPYTQYVPAQIQQYSAIYIYLYVHVYTYFRWLLNMGQMKVQGVLDSSLMETQGILNSMIDSSEMCGTCT